MVEKIETNAEQLMEMTTEIVSAHLSHNVVAVNDIPSLIRQIHSTLLELANSEYPEKEEEHEPAVPIRKSITREYLICLEDGKKLKMLKRYLRTAYDMSPSEYREKWNLPADYPMVAPNYSRQRSELAKSRGLGRKAGS